MQLQHTQRVGLMMAYISLGLADQDRVNTANGVEEGELEVASARGAVLQDPDHNVA